MRRRLPSVVVTHVFNEEYLLPWWLRHHVPMFDKGVVIDYASTDASLDIVRELAPHWEIVPSRFAEFSGRDCDIEVVEQERRFPGHWKIALTATEFLCVRDMDAFLAGLEAHGWPGYGIRSAILVDPPGAYDPEPDPARALVLQRHHGYFEGEALLSLTPLIAHCRLLHRAPDGQYAMYGRHQWTLQSWMRPPGAVLLHCLYSPLNPRFLARKLQIRGRQARSDSAQVPLHPHQLDAAQHEKRLRTEVRKAIDLRHHPAYAAIFGSYADVLAADPVPRERMPFLPGVGVPEGAWDPDRPRRSLWQLMEHGQRHVHIALEHWARMEADGSPPDPFAATLRAAIPLFAEKWMVKHMRKRVVPEVLDALRDCAEVHAGRADLWWNYGVLQRHLPYADPAASDAAIERARGLRGLRLPPAPDTLVVPPETGLKRWIRIARGDG